jgi:hypothetical protein
MALLQGYLYLMDCGVNQKHRDSVCFDLAIFTTEIPNRFGWDFF